MNNRHRGKQYNGIQFLLALAVFVLMLFAKTDFTHAVTCTPATCPQITGGLSAAVGIAIDESKSQAYFVEFNGGTLKRINLPPRCGIGAAPACSTTITTVAAGFSHPEDVQLDLDHGLAYVTTRDTPGTTGALWKVILSTGVKSLVTFNLGAPQQLFLDVPHDRAYTVGYDDKRLRSIDLGTGAKTPILTGLGHPVGLAVTKDKKYAYVAEQDSNQISKIDLTTGIKDLSPVVTGLISPFFLAWTNDAQNALYVVERDPANKVVKVDLVTHTKSDAVTGLPWRPTGIAVGGAGTTLYVTTDSAIVKVDTENMSDLLKEPIFVKVGHVPSTKINNEGYTSDPIEYYFADKHLTFGGTLDIFGNLNKFKALGATYYQVLLEGVPLNLSWNMYKWNPVIGEYVLVPVAPDSTAPNPAAGPKYKIPSEYPADAAWWVPSFLMMRWPSGTNGLNTFSVRIFDAGGADITSSGFDPGWKNSLTVNIDNTPLEAKILNICHKGTPGASTDPCYPDMEVKACDIVSAGSNSYYFKITAFDANHHLLNYWLSALWGENKTEVIYSDSYSAHVNAEGPYLWSGVANFIVPRDVPGSAGNPSTWPAKCNCAHTFYLGSWKRTIDGYNYILYGDYHKSVTINNVGVGCGLGPCGFPCP